MTVVLLDPKHQDLLPFAAAKLVNGPVQVTEDVSASVLWALPHAEVAVGDDGDPATVLISTDRAHPLVVVRVDRGEVFLTPPPEPETVWRSGTTLLDAVELMDRLRRTGPWESQQTHESLRRYVLEEVYELLDAIDVGTVVDLRDELGDLLLQVLFHARIAADDPTDPFDIDDVAQSFIDKVTRRTPGVLSGEHSDLERQIADWEAAKAAERERGSILDGIVTTAPALALAQKVLERVAQAGFPRSQVDPALLDVSLELGGDSVEDATRQRVLDLMDLVFHAEGRAAQEGVVPREPAQWLYYLGDQAYVPPVESAEPAVELFPDESAGPPMAFEPFANPPVAAELTDRFPPVDPPAAQYFTSEPDYVPAEPFAAEATYVPAERHVTELPDVPAPVETTIPIIAQVTPDLPITEFPTVIRPKVTESLFASPEPSATLGAQFVPEEIIEIETYEIVDVVPEPEPAPTPEPEPEPEPEPQPQPQPQPAGRQPIRIRDADEPEVTTTVPRPGNADELIGTQTRRRRRGELTGRVIFSSDEA